MTDKRLALLNIHHDIGIDVMFDAAEKGSMNFTGKTLLITYYNFIFSSDF